MTRIRFANAISGVLVVLCAGLFAYSTVPIRRDARITLLSQMAEPLPILIPDAGDFFELTESAPPGLRERLVYSRMPQRVRSPDPEPQLVADNWKRLRPGLAVVPAEVFFPAIARFYVLYTGGQREVLTDALKTHGGLSVAGREGTVWLFRAEVAGFQERVRWVQASDR
jgi:hypothetical protein